MRSSIRSTPATPGLGRSLFTQALRYSGTQVLVAAAALLLAASVPALAAPAEPAEKEGVALTVYNGGYGVVRDYTGHGVGPAFHTGLVIPHYDAAPGYDTLIEPGMVFTIEPMLNLGTPDWVMWDDDWTVLTADGRRSAQFEHTLLVTETGAEILTLP